MGILNLHIRKARQNVSWVGGNLNGLFVFSEPCPCANALKGWLCAGTLIHITQGTALQVCLQCCFATV